MLPKNQISNNYIVRLLRQMVASYQILGENYFKIIAYEKAADTIDQLNTDLRTLFKENKLNKLPGIGAHIGEHLKELLKTGKVRHFEETFKKMPRGMFYLLALSKVGSKTAYKLAILLNKLFKLAKNATEDEVLHKLEIALKKGQADNLEGFGPKKTAEILDSLKTYRQNKTKEKRMLLSVASEIGKEVISYLQKSKVVLKVDLLGSLRRRLATVGDIDIAVATSEPNKVIDYFINYEQTKKVVEKGVHGATIELKNGVQIDLRVVENKNYGSMLQYFTGSKQHNIALREYALKKGFSLSEYGIKDQRSNIKPSDSEGKSQKYHFSDEKSFYNFLDLEYIPPEIREDRGEIERAQKKSLPRLVKLSDIKGDLHIHSDYDLQPSHDLGESKMTEILKEASMRRYEYLGVSDHNPKQADLSESRINTIMKDRYQYFVQKKYLKKNEQNNFTVKKVFIMLEIDIKPNGELALPEESLEYLYAAIASIHSSFEMKKDLMTKRILRGLSHQKIKVLGHPTGRLLGRRESIQADWEKIFQYCKKRNIALEINAFPQRLDLPDVLVREAVRMGVKLIINTDSHHVSEMSLLQYGVDVARRGWATKGDIINTLSYDDFQSWLTT